MSTPPPSDDPGSDDRTAPPEHGQGQPQHGQGQPQHGQVPPQYGPPQYGPPQYGPPQYGPPQYGPPGQQWGPRQPWTGQPWAGQQAGVRTADQWDPAYATPAPPRDRTRTVLLTALVVLSVAIAAAVVALVYALSSTVLDRSSVEAAVAEQFEERAGVPLDLRCPEDMEVAAGAVYRCTGTTVDGETVRIEIRIADSLDGAYTWIEV